MYAAFHVSKDQKFGLAEVTVTVTVTVRKTIHDTRPCFHEPEHLQQYYVIIIAI
jgi:hypothetical protein